MKGESYLAHGDHSQFVTYLPESTSLSKSIRGLTLACLIVLIIGYFIQAWTPLRINTDSYRLLSMAVSAANGKGYLVDGAPDQYPKGYPWVVKCMLKIGIANSASLVILNLIALSISLSLLIMMLLRCGLGTYLRNIVIILSLSSWVIVKHVSLPVSDLLYTGLSFCSLACMFIFWQKSRQIKWLWFICSIGFTIAAIEVRSVGLTLIPTLILTAFIHNDSKSFRDFMRQHVLIVSLFVSSILVIMSICIFAISKTNWFFLQFLRKGSYFQNLLVSFKTSGILAFIYTNLSYRICELGQILINMPINKIPFLTAVFYGFGSLGWVALLYGFWILSNKLAPLIIYACVYLALMICWPYYDCRFWLPLIPIFTVAMLTAIEHLSHRFKLIGGICKIYMVYFVILGIVAISFSSRISLAGKKFSEVYGDGTERMTYRYVLKNNEPVDMKLVNEKQVHILKIFGMDANTVE